MPRDNTNSDPAHQWSISFSSSLVQRMDEARAGMSRSEYVRELCEQSITGAFPNDDGLSFAQRAYVRAFESHLRTDAGIDTAVSIAEGLAVTFERRNRRCA